MSKATGRVAVPDEEPPSSRVGHTREEHEAPTVIREALVVTDAVPVRADPPPTQRPQAPVMRLDPDDPHVAMLARIPGRVQRAPMVEERKAPRTRTLVDPRVDESLTPLPMVLEDRVVEREPAAEARPKSAPDPLPADASPRARPIDPRVDASLTPPPMAFGEGAAGSEKDAEPPSKRPPDQPISEHDRLLAAYLDGEARKPGKAAVESASARGSKADPSPRPRPRLSDLPLPLHPAPSSRLVDPPTRRGKLPGSNDPSKPE